MDGRITPSLVKKAASPIEMIEIVFVGLTSPKSHVCNFEVRPEVAGRISVRFLIVLRSPFAIHQPLHSILLVQIFGMERKKLDSLWPQSRYTTWGIIKIDGETIGLIVIEHITENIIIDIAEELNFRFDSPIVLRMG